MFFENTHKEQKRITFKNSEIISLKTINLCYLSEDPVRELNYVIEFSFPFIVSLAS